MAERAEQRAGRHKLNELRGLVDADGERPEILETFGVVGRGAHVEAGAAVLDDGGAGLDRHARLFAVDLGDGHASVEDGYKRAMV